jgi:hypothetical protein
MLRRYKIVNSKILPSKEQATRYKTSLIMRRKSSLAVALFLLGLGKSEIPRSLCERLNGFFILVEVDFDLNLSCTCR